MSKTKMPPSRMRLEVKNAAKTIGVLLSSVAALIFSSPKGYGMENFNSLDPIANLFYSNEIAAIDKYNGSYVQVNGKVRATLLLPVDCDKKKVEENALSLDAVKKYLNNQSPKRVIVVPNRIINVVC